jgi:prophage regulatory protein
MNDNLQLLRRTEVEELTGLSRTAIYDRMREGSFPKSIALSPKTIRWVRGEILKWIKEQIINSRR